VGTLILDHDLGRINTIVITMNIYSIVNFPCTGVDVYRRIQELFSFLFELGVIAQLYCRTTLCIDRAHLVNNKDKDVNINAVGKWTKVGVAAKTVKGNMYISIVVQVDPKA